MAPDAAAFKKQWTGWYSGAPPVGFVLRELYPDRWLRIHSLPAAQRYPSSDADWGELLLRHRAVATDVLGEGGACILVLARIAAPGKRLPERFDATSEKEASALRALNLTLLGPVEDDGPGVELLRSVYAGAVWLYGAELSWSAGVYDAVLRAVAQDQTGPLLMVSRTSGHVYAPYDGGADLFFRDSAERRSARERYQAWLSPFPGGL